MGLLSVSFLTISLSAVQVIHRANNTEYGLAATVITRDINKAFPIASALETGTVWINTHGQFDASACYGGMKQSGLGREYGYEGLLPYMETKTVFVALPETVPSIQVVYLNPS